MYGVGVGGGGALVIPLLEMGEQVRTSCNKACIFPNSADFKDRIFELPIRFCSLHELVGKYICFSLVIVWQLSTAFRFFIFYTHVPLFLCCHPTWSFD